MSTYFLGMKLICALILLLLNLPLSGQDEPQTAEVFYGLSAGNLVPLERQVPVIRGKASGYIVMTSKGTLEFSGGKSPVRFRSGVPLEFIVRPRATPATDPIKYCLRVLSAKRKIREIVITSGHASPFGASTVTNGSKGVLPLVYSHYGAYSYKLTTRALPRGEYALNLIPGRLSFCFGVD